MYDGVFLYVRVFVDYDFFVVVMKGCVELDGCVFLDYDFVDDIGIWCDLVVFIDLW